MNKKTLFLILSLAVLTVPLGVFGAVTCGGTGGITTLNDIVGRVSDAASVVGAGMAVIGFVVAGIMYLTAAGGSRMETAKKALISAVIGTAIIALAQGANIMTSIFCYLIVGK